MIKKYSFIFLVSLASPAACSTYSGVLTPPPNHNGALAVGTPADCQAMCEHLRLIHCPAGDPTPKGAPCEAVCENTESSGYASENPVCQSKAASCAAADACVDTSSP